MITQFVCLNLLPAAILKACGASLREAYIYVMYMNFIWLSIYLSVGLYVPNGIFTNVVLIYRAPSVVDCSFEDMFPVLFYIQQMLRGDEQTKKHVYQSLINNNFTYHITRFFHGKFFSCFAIYPSWGSNFRTRKIRLYVVNKETYCGR